MAKQLNVNLAFTADTSQVQQSINSLKASLQQITNMPSSLGVKMSADMQLAVDSAKELQIQLTNAFNVKTGNLDLNVLNTNLGKTGQNLSVLTTNLLKAGQTGQQAFMNIQRVVANSSVAVTKANGVLAQFATTLANTARWQLSSSILHGFMGALNSAFSYAEDLNESLNNIRIVTGYNVDKMTEFAQQANKAAKALNTTTVAYTDASLIYFQQGLNDDEVQKRTDVTVKMANVTGQSVVEVSNQLTAVWNNFAKGADNLEYYADVMTKLGAATASSSEEIATGLNKFAATAETVGLSYEYAAAALATVTATTRQSAEIVGTAFKTLFARLSDLKLGETLDDGTTLGQYSANLAKIGVNIKDASGALKDMDTILEETAAKWDGLDRAQQVALAKGVAGIRQYTQFIALMDNWDFMQTNLDTVADSEGALQQQADIYAESWEAAKKEVKASLESLYNELIPTEFLVDMTKAFADVIDGVSVFVKGLGGLKGILLVISTIILNKFQPAIANGINDAIVKVQGLGDKFRAVGTTINQSINGVKQIFASIGNLKNSGVEGVRAGFNKINSDIALSNNSLRTFNNQIVTIEKGLTGSGQQTAYLSSNIRKSTSEMLKMQQLTLQQAATQTDMNSSFGIYLDNMSQIYNIQNMIEQHSRSIAAIDKAKLSAAQEQVIAATERKLLADQELEALRKQHETLIAIGDQEMVNNSRYYDTNNFSSYNTGLDNDDRNHNRDNLTQGLNLAEEYMAANGYAQDLELTIEETNGQLEIQSTKSDGIFTLAQAAGEQYSKVLDYNTQIATILSDQTMTEEEKQRQINGIVAKMEKEKVISSATVKNYRDAATALTKGDKAGRQLTAQMRQTSAQTRQFALTVGNSTKYLTKVEESTTRVAGAQIKVNQASLQHNQALANTISLLQNVVAKTQSVGGVLSGMFSGLSTIAMGWNSISNAIDAVKDKEASFGEKFTAIAMAGTMGFQALMTVMKGVSTVTSTLAAKQAGLIGVNKLLATSEQKTAIATALGNTVTKESIALDESQAIADAKELLMNKLQISDATAEAYAREFVNKAKKGDIALSAQETITNIGLAASEYAVLWPLLLIIAALAALAAIALIIVATCKKEKSALEVLTESIEEQKQSIESLKNTLEEAKEELKEIISLLDEYSNLDDAFDGLIEGSVEWLNNLQRQNEIIKELLEKYPELVQMGAIGFKDGILQILNKDLVNQYVRGSATINVLQKEIGLLSAQQTLAIANAKQKTLSDEKSIIDMYKRVGSRKVNFTKLQQTSSGEVEITSQVGSQVFKHISTDSKVIEKVKKGKADDAIGYLDLQMERYATEVMGMMESGVKTAEEAVQNILKADTTDFYNSQARIDLLTTMAKTMYVEFEEIWNEELAVRARLIKEFEMQWKVQAQSILSHQQGFAELTDAQQAALTAWVGRQFSINNAKYDYGLVGQDQTLSVDFVEHLANAFGQTTNWRQQVSTTAGYKDPTNDAGDFFRDNDFGKYLLDTYLREEKGIQSGIAGIQNDENFSRDPYKITYGDDQTIRYTDILEYFSGQAKYESINYGQAIDTIKTYSEDVLAAMAGDVSEVTEDKLLKHNLVTKTDEGYQLNTDSEVYKQVEKVMGYDAYDPSKTQQNEEEWNAMKKDWQEQLKKSVEMYDAAFASTRELQRSFDEGNALIASEAEKYGLASEDVQRYAKSIYNANKAQNLNYESAARMAIQNARLSKGLKSLRENWEKNSEALNTYNKDSYEYFEVISDIASSLTDVFGVDISADFIETNKEKIQILAEGGEKAAEVFQELELLAAKDYIANLAIDDTYKTQFSTMIDELHSLEQSAQFTVGFKGEIDQSYIDSMQKLLDSGALTVDQIQSMFNSLGWQPNISYDEQETINETISQIFTGDQDQVLSGQGEETWERIVTYTTTQVPVIGKDVTAIPKANSSVTAPNTQKSSNGSNSNKKEKKNLQQEKERYYQINQQLDTLANKLDRIGKAKERAFGKAKSDLIKQEIELIDQEIAKTDELLAGIEQYAQEDLANLMAFGFKTDADNNITNYDEIMAKEVNRYNQAIESGNESSIAAAEKRWELFKESLKQYEETMDKWDDTIVKQMENKNKKYQALFENITYTIEVDLGLEDDDIKLLDHLLSLLEDKAFSAAEAIALLGDKTQNVLDQTSLYAKGITDILSLHGLDEQSISNVLNGSLSIEDIKDEYGFSDDDIDQLRTYIDGLMTANTDLMTIRNNIQEKIITTFQEWNEEMDKGISKLDSLSGIIESYANIIDLIGKDTLGIGSDLMKQIAQATTTNSINIFKANKAKYDSVVEARNKAEEEYQKAIERGDEASIEKWKNKLKEINIEVDSAHQTMLDSWQSALEAAQSEFETAVEETLNVFESSVSGTFKRLEDLQTVFDQQNEVIDRYVQDYEKIYELSKLIRDTTKSIDETSNIKAKKVLRNLQQEILDLQNSGAQASKYDLNYLQAKYELRLAEIALEEAQNAKTHVRMRKDSEGNYSYVFTANEQAIAEAEQNYEDKLYAMQQLNSEYLREMQNNILQSEIELVNALRQLDRTKYASDAEYYAEVSRLQEYYNGQRNYHLDELNKALINNQSTYSQDWTWYSEYSGYKISADKDYIDNFEETLYAQLKGYESITEAQQTYMEATDLMVKNLVDTFKYWYNKVDSIMKETGTSIKDFADSVEASMEDINKTSEQSTQEVQDAAEDFINAFNDVCDEVTSWQELYSEALTDAMDSNLEMINSCNDLIEMLSNVDGGLDTTSRKFMTTASNIEAAARRIEAAARAAAAASSGVGSSQGGAGTSGQNSWGGAAGDYDWHSTYDPVKVTHGANYYDPSGSGAYFFKAGSLPAGKYYLVGDYDSGAIKDQDGKVTKSNEKFVHIMDEDDNMYIVAASSVTQMDTGGYTGQWGQEGRLAMLHQKELVLNPGDTENMLSAINIIRNISRIIDLNAAASASLFGTIGATLLPHNEQTLQQEVTIHAEFPNATNHSEIEEAFNTLMNQATQFANRKN